MMDKILNLLGIAKRAGRLTTGEEKTIESVRGRSAKIVFLASDAGASTSKKIRDKCSYYDIPLIDEYTNAELSQATGASNRVVLSITDPGFSKRCWSSRRKESDSMSKIRIHEYAKENGVSSKEVVEFLQNKGIEANSHMKSLEDEEITVLNKK